jgi:hypothetical protein
LLSHAGGWQLVPCPLPEGVAYDQGAEQLGYQLVGEWGQATQLEVNVYRAADHAHWLIVACSQMGCDVLFAMDMPSMIQVVGPLVQLAAAGVVLDAVEDAAEADAEARRRTPEPPAPPRPPRPRTPRGWRRP